MLITRKFGALLRGKATPFQIYSATLLGSLLAFNPGFAQAPGLMLLLLGLLIVLNANLFLAGLVGLGAKILYWLLLPGLFQLGIFLIEGPTQGLFALFANAPILAWFGFEYYVVSAGVLVGGLCGLLSGWLINRQIRGARQRLARWENDSEAFAKWSHKRSVKVLAFLFLGGTKPKKSSWNELAAHKGGSPIRLLGAAFVVFSTVLAVITFLFLNQLILTELTRSTLQRVNGASVDLTAVNYEASEGRLTITGLAMADSNNLRQNLFEADQVVADVSGLSLLRRKVALDRLSIENAASGRERRVPGQLVTREPTTFPSLPKIEPGDYELEDVLNNAGLWKERLAQVQRWIERFSPSSPDEADAPEDAVEALPSWRERLALEAEARGYEAVASENLLRAAPRFSIAELDAIGIVLAQLPGERLDLRGKALSTHPWLGTQTPEISVQAQSGKFGGTLRGESFVSETAANALNFFYQDLDATELRGLLKDPSQFPIESGMIDLASNGTQQGSTLHLPVTATLRQARVTVANLKPFELERLEIPVTISGTIASPQIRVDPSSFQEALKGAATGVIKDEATRRIEEAVGDRIPSNLRNLFPGGGG